MLNQHPVLTLLSGLHNDTVDSTGEVVKSGYATYNIPIILNNEICVLRVTYMNDSQTYKIIGAIKGNETTNKNRSRVARIASRGVISLKVGDEITPILSAIVPAEDVDNNNMAVINRMESGDASLAAILFKGETFKLETEALIQNETLEDGDYYYQFIFHDPLGNRAESEGAYFDVFDGEVLYSDKVDDNPSDTENEKTNDNVETETATE